MGSEYWKQVPFGFISVWLFVLGCLASMVAGWVLRGSYEREERRKDQQKGYRYQRSRIDGETQRRVG